MAKIIDFYLAKKIRFFLFAPHLTLFSGNRDVCHIVIDKAITYENGAKVNTAFMTNLETGGVRLCPELRECICKNEKTKVNHVKYEYPPNVITSTSLGFIVKRGVKLKIKRDECYFLRSLDAQKKIKKAIYGGGFLVSNRLAKMIKAHREAIEKKEEKESLTLELSEKEKEIIKMLEKSDK